MKEASGSDKKKAKIIPFRQDVDFFLKRGEAGLDQNDPVKAVSRYRRAYDTDRTDLDSCLGLADTLGRMQRYEESNRILLVDMSMNEPDAEHYFGMATNYYGMQEFEYARESLETYLTLDPNGYYAQDAVDFLDVLEDEEELSYQTGIASDELPETLTVCNRARQAMNCGAVDRALTLLTEHLKKVPGALRAINQLAIVKFLLGEKEQAQELLRKVLKEDSKDIQAHVSLAYFMDASDNREDALSELSVISGLQLNEPEELASVSCLQLQLGQYSDALKNLKELVKDSPFDPVVLHHLATANYAMGNNDAAADCYLTLLRITPDDTVAKYYLNLCRNTHNLDIQRAFSPTYEVPLSEALRRYQALREISRMSLMEIREKWCSDKDFRNLLLWSLTAIDQRPKAAIIQLIGAMHDTTAEIALRDFLLRTDQADIDKHEALGMLKKLNIHGPFMAYLDGQWIQGDISSVFAQTDLPAALRHIFDHLTMHAIGNCSEECIAAVAQVLQQVFQNAAQYINLPPAQQLSLAAAIELRAHEMAGETVNVEEIVSRYGITQRRLNNARSLLMRFMEA